MSQNEMDLEDSQFVPGESGNRKNLSHLMITRTTCRDEAFSLQGGAVISQSRHGNSRKTFGCTPL